MESYTSLTRQFEGKPLKPKYSSIKLKTSLGKPVQNGRHLIIDILFMIPGSNWRKYRESSQQDLRKPCRADPRSSTEDAFAGPWRTGAVAGAPRQGTDEHPSRPRNLFGVRRQ